MQPTAPLDVDPLLQAISDQRLQSLAARGVLRSYRRNTLLMQEGDIGSTVLVVLAGRLKAYSDGAAHATSRRPGLATRTTAPREITYGVYGPGDLVGEMTLDGGPRSASVIALEPVVCSVISRETIRDYIGEEPEFAFDLLARVIVRARRATQTTRGLVLDDAYGRLSELLLTQAEEQPDGTHRIPHRLTHQDIANRIGCSREMVSRLLKDLEIGGHIVIDAQRRYVLKQPLPAQW